MTIRSIADRAMDAALIGYSRLGHFVRRGGWEALPGDALDGRVVVVTGATSGIGLASAAGAARLGAEVVMVGRDPDRTVDAAEKVTAEARAPVRPEIADLSLMGDVKALAARLAGSPVHVLVNNAGVLLRERTVTAEGIEATFATNLLGHFALTSLLIPTLVDSAPARIVNVASGLPMYVGRISDDLESERGEYDGTAAYALTKRGQTVLTEIWADRLRDHGVVVHAMHPGWAKTPGVASGLPLFNTLMRPWLRTPQQGADTVVWLAASVEAGESTGRFWHDRAARPAYRTERSRETAGERWAFWRRLHEYLGWEDPG
jgi:NAD(P)-dependent dehydrogenase (short-subunit alcohol dehydrogenase family)